MKDGGNSSALAIELLQSCTKPSMYSFKFTFANHYTKYFNGLTSDAHVALQQLRELWSRVDGRQKSIVTPNILMDWLSLYISLHRLHELWSKRDSWQKPAGAHTSTSLRPIFQWVDYHGTCLITSITRTMIKRGRQEGSHWCHYNDVIMRALASLISSVTIVEWFVQAFVHAPIKENIIAPRHWLLWGEFAGNRWIARTKGQQRGKCFHLMTSSQSWSLSEAPFCAQQ